MATKKVPVRQVPRVEEVSPTLMGNQDTKRGDARNSDKVRFNLMIPENLLEEAKELAAEEGTSVAKLCIEGLRWRLNRDK